MTTYFWFIAGMLTGLCAALIAFPLLRGTFALLERRTMRIVLAAFGVVAFAAVALVLYRTLGRPELLGAHAVAAPAGHPDVGASASGEAPDSMENVVARLEARLARGEGKREDWLLLAQAYDFMGRPADAQRARQSAESGGPRTAQAGDADALRALASTYRRQREYTKARDAFAKLTKLGAMDADTWADYADTLASTSGGSLRGDAAKAIDAALRLSPAHPKALWLKASLAHEEHRYSDALVVWKQLRAVLPAGSSDVSVVDANIAEDSELAGVRVAASVAPAVASSAAVEAEVTGTVAVDSRLAAKVPPGATLFIYAKAVDSPGPPLAVLRQVANSWPVTFRLDDTLAMIPSRKLSQFDRVIVEARISRSGQATPAAGDLYVTSAVLKPTERKKLALVIDHEVG